MFQMSLTLSCYKTSKKQYPAWSFHFIAIASDTKIEESTTCRHKVRLQTRIKQFVKRFFIVHQNIRARHDKRLHGCEWRALHTRQNEVKLSQMLFANGKIAGGNDEANVMLGSTSAAPSTHWVVSAVATAANNKRSRLEEAAAATHLTSPSINGSKSSAVARYKGHRTHLTTRQNIHKKREKRIYWHRHINSLFIQWLSLMLVACR